jgi:replication factor C small subunit
MTGKVWCETYRPAVLEDCILPARLKKTLEDCVSSGSIPNLLLTGSAGIGKTTAARALGNELGYTVLVINCSDEGRFLDTFRNKVEKFCTGVSIDGTRKLLILDEICNVTHDVQSLLRGYLEKHSKNCAFIATANFPAKLMEPIRSRFSEVEFSIRADEKKQVTLDFFKRVSGILAKEKVEFDRAAVAQVVSKFFPDFRRTLNELQRYSVGGSIDTGIFAGASGDMDQLIGFIRDKSWNGMRKWVAEQAGLDFAVLTKTMYTRAGEFIKIESQPQLVLIIAEWQYKIAFVQDREIAVVAFLTQTMAECEVL